MTKNVNINNGSKVAVITEKANIHNLNVFNNGENQVPKRLTTHLPTISPDKIIGRHEELADLHKRLFDNKQVVLVNGLGGIGKTTLAQAYLGEYSEKYNHVAWIGLISDDLHQDFMNTEGLLANLDIQSEGKTSPDIFLEILRKLQGIENKPCLMIIDNADTSLSKWKDYLPNQPYWHVLVTSRETIQRFDPKNLDFLSEEDAVALFLSHYNQGKIDKEGVRKIVSSVDLHTLTVEILAKTAQKQRSSFDDLMKAVQNDIRANVDVRHKGEKIERITSYLCSIFTLSRLFETEIRLLKFMACLPSEFHTFERLEILIGPSFNPENVSLSESLENLADKGWLMRNPDTGSFKIHRIIMDVVKRETPVRLSDVEGLLETITEILSIDQTRDNPVEKFPWVPFGFSMLTALSKEQVKPPVSLLQSKLAWVIQDLGDYDRAKELLEKAMKSDEKNFGSEHPRTVVSCSNLASVLKDLGDYVGAKKLFEKAMKSDEKNFGPDHPITAVRYSNLATVLKDLGDYAGANELLEKAMESDEKNFGPDHPTISVRYSNLALVLYALGKYDRAKELLEKAIKSDEKNFGPDHPSTARSYSNLSVVLKDIGNYSGAKELLEKAMKSAERNFGPDHPNTAVCYSNLALVLQVLGYYTRAKELFENAIKSAETNLGFNHPTTVIYYSNLSTVLQDLGDYARAKTLLEKAMKSAQTNLGSDHPTTAVCYSNLATVLQALGDYASAKILLEKAMKSAETNFGLDHPNTAVSYSNLAMVLQNFGDYAGAKALLEKVIESNERNFGTNHPNTARSYSNLATVLYSLCDNEKALGLAEKAFSIFQNRLPEGHPYIQQAKGIRDGIKQIR